jgi:RND family efflux transporter MFP subunit
MTKLSFAITIVAVSVSLWSCTEARPADLTTPTPVKVQPVEEFSMNNGLRYSATIRSSAQMELAFKNGGFVDSIQYVSGRLIDQGDGVAKGAVLANLRQADFQHRLDQSSAQLSDARAALESAKGRAADNQARLERASQDFARSENLFNSQSLTRSSYDAAKAEFDSGRAKVDSAKADIESAQSRILTAEAAVADAKLAMQDAAIVAPMNGTIIQRNIEVGSLWAAGKAAFVLADTRTVKAVFGVPDLEIPNVKMGMPLVITSEALPDQTFVGRVTSIAPAADEKSRLFDTEVTIPNSRGVLKPGMIASIVIGTTTSSPKLPAVPLGAIVRSKDASESYAVFVMEMNDGRPAARLRNIKLGDAFGNMIVVKEGLRVGENVISVGATLIHDGSAVQIVP